MHTIGIAFACDATDVQLLPAMKEFGRRKLGGLILSNFALSYEACREISKTYDYEALTIIRGVDGFRHDNVMGLITKNVYDIKIDGLIFNEVCNPFDEWVSTIENLDVINTNLNEEAIRVFIHKRNKLEWLTCNNTNMSIKCVELACEIPTLKYIGLKGCGISVSDLCSMEIRSGLQVGI